MNDDENIIDHEPEHRGQLTRREPAPADLVPHEPDATSPISFAGGMSLLPVEQQNVVLPEYVARRTNFRQWLFSQLEKGVHFGFVPGCEPRFDSHGNIMVWNSKKNENMIVRPDQWRARPTLYQAGAELLLDLCKLRPEFTPDMDTWKMMGEPKGVVCSLCQVIDMRTGEVVGSGRGAYKVGEKGMNENSAVKLSQKRAMVDATIKALKISDLFTQDLEKPQAPASPQPRRAEDVPTVPPRGERHEPAPEPAPEPGSPAEIRGAIASVYNTWKRIGDNKKLAYADFAAWAAETAGVDVDLNQLENWNLDTITLCQDALR